MTTPPTNAPKAPVTIFGTRNNQIQEMDDSEVDVELITPNNFFSTHVNLIPLQSAVQGPRLFYGARFYNQALPLMKPEAPLVQNLDDSDADGFSFDEKLGRKAGALFADEDSEVQDVTPDGITVRRPDGSTKNIDLYNNFIFNRKSINGASTILIRRQGTLISCKIADYEFTAGDEVQSFCPITKLSKWQEVTGYIKHENDKKLLCVTYESGRSVVVTEDHSLLTLDDKWEITPVYPMDCVVNSTKSPHAFGCLPDTGTQADYDEGTLVGLYLAEGHLGKQAGLVQISVLPPARIAEAKDLVYKVLGITAHDAKVNCGFTSHTFYRFLEDNCGKGSGNKFISDMLLNKPRKYLEGIIAGYMAGDGCLWEDKNKAIQVAGVTTSVTLRNDLTKVLNLLGIFTTHWDAPRKHINPNWNDAFGFRVISTHICKLPRWFFYEDREDKLRQALKVKFRASPFEHIPVHPSSVKAMYNSLPGNVPPMVYQYAYKRRIAKHALTNATGNFGLWASSDILWDKITDITPAPHEAYVYDLEVNASQAFAVNGGLLVHNTSITHTPLIKKGDIVKKGQILAKSNYTDDKGTLALGANAVVGLVPFKGHSMDDAIVVSSAFAKRLTSDHAYTHEQDFDRDTKGGLNHYVSLFPTAFNKDQLKKMDKTGVIRPGSVVQAGDPLILATRPRSFSSTTSQLGKLSKAMRQSRHDSSQLWDSEFPGVVTDVAKTKTGYKVIVKSETPTQAGDKIVFRSGQKGIISRIIPDEQMPRTKSGQPMEVLLNPLGIPSRVNNSLIYELLLGKAAAKRGSAIKLPSFNKKGEKWYDMVAQALKENDLPETEELFDPVSNRLLENQVTVGVGHVLKLHHVAASKESARGQGGYDCYDDQTEVLTKRGWVKWPDVTIADEFYTVINDSCTYKKAEKIVSYDFTGDLYGYESKYLNWLTTYNHEHLVKLKKHWKKITSAELYGKNRFTVKQFGFGALPGKSPEYIDLPAPNFTQNKRRNKEWRGVSIKIEDYASFIGWWIAEGSVVFNEEESRYRVYIWQHDAANPEESRQIRALLDRLPFANWSEHRDVNDALVGYYISDAALAQHLIVCYGRTCGEKRLWRDVFTWEPAHRALVLKNAMLGDGSEFRHKKNSATRIKPNVIESYATTSEALANDIQELCISLGFGALISAYPEFYNNKGYLCKPYFIVGIHRTRTDATARTSVKYAGKHVKVPYSGKVYCATIPESGLLYVRRDKKPLLSGNSNQQPLKGGSDAAQAKRMSGLEINSMLSSGAYKNIKEGATLRGQQNDEYWRALRQGYKPKTPGTPFVWEKFQALLTGAGLQARKLPKGELRLGPFTADDLDKHGASEVKSGELVDLNTMEPAEGGLFDQVLVGSNKWGKIPLPFKVPNPAFEGGIRSLLGLTEKELRAVLSGTMDLPDNSH